MDGATLVVLLGAGDRYIDPLEPPSSGSIDDLFVLNHDGDLSGLTIDSISRRVNRHIAHLTLAYSGDIATDETLTVTVKAAAHSGSSDLTSSAAANTVTILALPGAPTGVGVTSGDTQLTVSWTAPTDTGGKPITGYTAIAATGTGTRTCTARASETNCVITGLTNGREYAVTVLATTASGNSNPSSPAVTAMPRAVEMTLDVDGNEEVEALTDGLLILRVLLRNFEPTQVSLTNALGTGARRTTATDIVEYLQGRRSRLDVDGNDKVEALTDGLLVLRALLRNLDPAQVSLTNALGTGARRTTATDIVDYVRTLVPE